MILDLKPHTPEWYEYRKTGIGASEVSALFNLNTYISKFELWHQKAQKIEVENHDSILTRAGLHMEDFIIKEFSDMLDVEVEKANHVVEHDSVKGMFATPDAYIIEGGKRTGILEIKNVCQEAIDFVWIDGQPPLSYEFQIMHQMACTGLKKATICALVSCREILTFDYVWNDKAINAIKNSVSNFWRSVERNEPPEADADKKTFGVLKKVYPVKKGEKIDMSKDNILPDYCQKFLVAKENKKNFEEAYTETRNLIKQKIKEYQEVVVNGYVVSQTANGNLNVRAV